MVIYIYKGGVCKMYEINNKPIIFDDEITSLNQNESLETLTHVTPTSSNSGGGGGGGTH